MPLTRERSSSKGKKHHFFIPFTCNACKVFKIKAKYSVKLESFLYSIILCFIFNFFCCITLQFHEKNCRKYLVRKSQFSALAVSQFNFTRKIAQNIKSSGENVFEKVNNMSYDHDHLVQYFRFCRRCCSLAVASFEFRNLVCSRPCSAFYSHFISVLMLSASEKSFLDVYTTVLNHKARVGP